MNDLDVREYTFRLHRSGAPWGKRADEIDWDDTAVGEAVNFKALHFGQSAWSALAPVTTTAPEALPDAAWSVAAGIGDTPLFVGNVGHPLAKGEMFTLPVAIVGGVTRD